MVHQFLEPKAWRRPKRYGYGAGAPIAWQGWALLLSCCAAAIGLAALATRSSATVSAGLGTLIAILTAIFVVIARTRTGGDWRWGDGD